MTIHRLPILEYSILPDGSGNVFFEPYNVKATNDVWKQGTWIFNDTGTRIGLYGSFTVPKNYVSGAVLVLVWTSTATAGDVEWDFDYRAVGGDDVESLDQSGTQESVNDNDTAPTSTDLRLEKTIVLTDGNFAVDDEVLYQLFRDGNDGGDTMAAAVSLFKAYFEYADS